MIIFFLPNSFDNDNISPLSADLDTEYESLLFLEISCQIELITHNLDLFLGFKIQKPQLFGDSFVSLSRGKYFSLVNLNETL